METHEVRSIRVWMREVMESKGWSANKWAELAVTSPTNITRFLKDATHVPSSRTIAKLAYVAGTSPSYSLVPIRQGEINAVALFDECRKSLGVISVWGIKGEVTAYQLSIAWPVHEMKVDDILIVKETKKFSAGDKVVAFHDDNFLVMEATSENNKFVSGVNIYTAKQIEIAGKVVQIIRNLHD